MTKAPGLRVLRRDFVEQQCCAFCDRALTSGIGYVVLHPEKNQQAAGPDCAAKVGRVSDFPVPDLTRGVVAGRFDLPQDRQAIPDDIPSPQRALEYVLMRSRFKKDDLFHPLQVALEAYRQDAVLSPALVQPVLKGLDASARASPRESERTITHAYAALRMIDRCRTSGRLDQRGTALMGSFRQQLVERHWLSPKQIDVVNAKLQIVSPNAPRLDRTGFRLPYYAPARKKVALGRELSN